MYVLLLYWPILGLEPKFLGTHPAWSPKRDALLERLSEFDGISSSSNYLSIGVFGRVVHPLPPFNISDICWRKPRLLVTFIEAIFLLVNFLLRLDSSLRKLIQDIRLCTFIADYKTSFRPKKTITDAFKPVISLLPEDSRDAMEVSLLEATNILLKYIRQGIYSIIRTLYTKNATESDLKLLFAFLESSAHSAVVSLVQLIENKYAK